MGIGQTVVGHLNVGSVQLDVWILGTSHVGAGHVVVWFLGLKTWLLDMWMLNTLVLGTYMLVTAVSCWTVGLRHVGVGLLMFVSRCWYEIIDRWGCCSVPRRCRICMCVWKRGCGTGLAWETWLSRDHVEGGGGVDWVIEDANFTGDHLWWLPGGGNVTPPPPSWINTVGKISVEVGAGVVVRKKLRVYLELIYSLLFQMWIYILCTYILFIYMNIVSFRNSVIID